MPNLVIRNVPDAVRQKIRREMKRRQISQSDFLVSVLETAMQQDVPLLFDEDETSRSSLGSASATAEDRWSLPFTFIDLFAGIGGMRLGLEAVGGQCVFSCEWDRHARQTYEAWFGDDPGGDVTELSDQANLPQHDVLAAGFPCQPFSIAGVSKKKSLGREHGFKDRTQGTLFFHLATIIEKQRPPVLLLENVKNLKSHDKGNTWNTISETLNQLNYVVFDQVIDAAHWVPQHRERIVIVGFDREVFGDHPPFEFPQLPDGPSPQFKDVLDDDVDDKYTLTDRLWQYLQDYAAKHKAKGNGFGCSIADPNGITRTLSARYHKDGSEILISQGKKKNPRRLTPREAGRLMGFPERLLDQKVVSDTQSYRQFGNAVVPPVFAAVGQQIVDVLRWQLLKQNGCLLKR